MTRENKKMELLPDTVKGEDTRLSKTDDTALYIEAIHQRAETVTPLLKEFLELRPPPHWN